MLNKETCTQKKERKQILSKNIELFHKWNWLCHVMSCYITRVILCYIRCCITDVML